MASARILRILGSLTSPSGSITAMGWLNVRDYGAKCDGATNDTAAIQAALNAAASTGAGSPSSTVYIPAGYTVTGALTLPHGVTLRGAGMRSTTLVAAPALATGTYLISNIATARMMAVMDLRLIGNSANQTTGNLIYGLQYNATGTGVEYTDMRAQARSVHIEDFTGDAFTLAGRGVSQLTDCSAFNCGGNGFVLGVDNYVTGCDAGSCLNGFLINGCTQLSNCKAWFSGYRNGTVPTGTVSGGNGHGFKLTGSSGNALTSIVAQDNAATGIYLDGCTRVTISGWITDSNNNYAGGTCNNVEMNAAYNCTLTSGYNFDRNPPNAARPVSGFKAYSASGFNNIQFVTDGLLVKVNSASLTYQNVVEVDQSMGGSVAQAYAASFTPDNTQGTVIDVGVLTGNLTINAPVLSANGGHPFTLMFTQDATGSRTVTWNAAYRSYSWQPTATANAHSNVTFVWNANAGIWEKMASQN